jgi:glutaredoxin
MKEQKWVIGIVVGLIALGGIFFALSSQKQPEDILANADAVAFGQYMKEQGVKFYGAEWCPHCQNQKKALGKGAWEPVFVECYVAGQKEQAKACADANIESYPTWVFKDGSRKTGEIAVDELKRLTGYTTPVPAATTTE